MKIGYYQGSNANNNVTCFLERHAEESPDKVAFYWLNSPTFQNRPSLQKSSPMHRTMTMGELVKLSSYVASGFVELGIKRGDRVIIFTPMSAQLYITMSALQRIGAIPVFLDSWTRRMNLTSSIRQVQPVGIISYNKAFQFGKAISDIDLIPIKISIDKTDIVHAVLLDDLAKRTVKARITEVGQEDTALITFTTGSSGEPKGANRTHRFLAAQHYALKRHIPYKKDDVDLPVFPVFALNNIAAGVSTVLPAIDLSEPNKNDAQVLLNQVENCSVNCATLSPSLFRHVADYCLERGIILPNLKRVVTGGAPVSRDDVLKFKSISKAKVLVLYGSTEVEPIAHIIDKEIIFDTDHQAEEGVKVGRVDRYLRYKLLKILKHPIEINNPGDWAKLETIPGKAGELIVAGEHVCKDYFRNLGAFKRAKIKDLDGTIWHRTGDVGRFDKMGNFWLLGRVHNAIMRNGEHFFPVQSEIILKRLPFVRSAAYLGIEDPQLGEKALAVIAPKESLLNSKNNSWESQIRGILKSNHIPVDGILITNHIPMDPRHHSKVEYDSLRRQLIEDKQI